MPSSHGQDTEPGDLGPRQLITRTVKRGVMDPAPSRSKQAVTPFVFQLVALKGGMDEEVKHWHSSGLDIHSSDGPAQAACKLAK